MIRKDDPAFKKAVDDIDPQAMIKSGEFEKLYDKWFHVADPAAQHQRQPADGRRR